MEKITKEYLLHYLESQALVNQIVIEEARRKTPAQRLRELDNLYLSGLALGWFTSPQYEEEDRKARDLWIRLREAWGKRKGDKCKPEIKS